MITVIEKETKDKQEFDNLESFFEWLQINFLTDHGIENLKHLKLITDKTLDEFLETFYTLDDDVYLLGEESDDIRTYALVEVKNDGSYLNPLSYMAASYYKVNKIHNVFELTTDSSFKDLPSFDFFAGTHKDKLKSLDVGNIDTVDMKNVDFDIVEEVTNLKKTGVLALLPNLKRCSFIDDFNSSLHDKNGKSYFADNTKLQYLDLGNSFDMYGCAEDIPKTVTELVVGEGYKQRVSNMIRALPNLQKLTLNCSYKNLTLITFPEGCAIETMILGPSFQREMVDFPKELKILKVSRTYPYLKNLEDFQDKFAIEIY